MMMKKELGKKHDEIILWISNNSKEFVTNFISVGESVIVTEIDGQQKIMKGKKELGYFDYILECQNKLKRNSPDDEPNIHYYRFFVIVNADLPSAVLQLRELLDLVEQYNLNKPKSKMREPDSEIKKFTDQFVIVSTNDTYRKLFEDKEFLFYKYGS